MDYATARIRILNHAGLAGEELPAQDSLVHVMSNSGGVDPNRVSALADDVVRCLSVANLELNGPVPSESLTRQNSSVLEELAPALSHILADSLRPSSRWRADPGIRAIIEQALWRIALAWSMLLDGDFDDLAEDVRLQAECDC